MIVLWRITERCNLSCGFCAYDRRLSWPRRDADVATIERFGRVLADYQRTSGDDVLVSWIGGEPFLVPELFTLTRLFSTEFGLRVSATTNGTLLGSPTLRDHILDHYAELTISIDGIGSIHDKLRGWRHGYTTLRKALTELANKKHQRQGGPRLRANVVLMRQTVYDFPQLCFELAEWGLDEISFNQLGGRDRPEFFSDHRLLPGQSVWLSDAFAALHQQLAARGVTLSGSDDYLRRIRASSRGEKILVRNCMPGTNFLFINEAGVASPCNFTVDGYGVDLQTIKSAEALCELPSVFARLQAEKHLVPCKDCHSTHVFTKFTGSTAVSHAVPGTALLNQRRVFGELQAGQTTALPVSSRCNSKAPF